ncbi:MAG: hypothetical protein ABSF91_00305 [Bacteroidota bacterium]|jgi:Zn-dependent metalloprotease
MRTLMAVAALLVVGWSLCVNGCAGSGHVYQYAEPWNTGLKDIDNCFLNRGLLTHEVIDSLGRKLISENKAHLHIDSVILERIRDDRDGWACSWQQTQNGVPVQFSQIGIMIRGDGTVWSSGAEIFPDVRCATVPHISGAQAREIVIKDFGCEKFEIREEPALVILPERLDTVVYHLTWKMKISKIPAPETIYFVGVDDGRVILRRKLEWQ